jgi:hypothetical protein
LRWRSLLRNERVSSEAMLPSPGSAPSWAPSAVVPAGRLNQTMAAEVGDAGGPRLVGAIATATRLGIGCTASPPGMPP